MSEIQMNSIVDRIYFLRDKKVMLDVDLALLYGLETRLLKQSVRRNLKRFPEDFMFELTQKEIQSLRSQSVTLKRGQHSKYKAFAFTEQAIAMLSVVLASDRAISVNIAIMRAFTQFRTMAFNVKSWKRKSSSSKRSTTRILL
jgi:hypothetical protein